MNKKLVDVYLSKVKSDLHSLQECMGTLEKFSSDDTVDRDLERLALTSLVDLSFSSGKLVDVLVGTDD